MQRRTPECAAAPQVRGYSEASGQRTRGTLTFGRPLQAASLADRIGQARRGKVFFEGNTLRFHLQPFEIRTVLVQLR